MPNPFAMWPIFVGISLCVVIGIIALARRRTRKKEDVYRLNDAQRTHSSNIEIRENKPPAQAHPPQGLNLNMPATQPKSAAQSPMKESKDQQPAQAHPPQGLNLNMPATQPKGATDRRRNRSHATTRR